ncbi:hypothetical protein L1987_58471 [Smallanthus sonchifolius]|uniref:Uncharacterized protein n=1 Tax=Smallanthus sonchifolius TaxID=185202 RepID=A0ACB9DG03_9ASTR|nr:hypothetical protein L1987_58471 [Smallanthus sonchifolius]
MTVGINGSSSPKPEVFPAGLRVLVIDDDATWLKFLEKMLKKCSYEGPPSPLIPPEIASHVLEGVNLCDGILRNLFCAIDSCKLRVGLKVQKDFAKDRVCMAVLLIPNSVGSVSHLRSAFERPTHNASFLISTKSSGQGSYFGCGLISSRYCLESSLNHTKTTGKVLLCRHAERSTESKLAKSEVVKAAGGVGMISETSILQ